MVALFFLQQFIVFNKIKAQQLQGKVKPDTAIVGKSKTRSQQMQGKVKLDYSKCNER